MTRYEVRVYMPNMRDWCCLMASATKDGARKQYMKAVQDFDPDAYTVELLRVTYDNRERLELLASNQNPDPDTILWYSEPLEIEPA